MKGEEERDIDSGRDGGGREGERAMVQFVGGEGMWRELDDGRQGGQGERKREEAEMVEESYYYVVHQVHH